jgi:hypothetical protein
MPSATIKLKDRWFRLIGIPLIAFMSHVIFFNENHGVADKAYSGWQVYLISVVEATILWEGNRLVLIYFRKKYPELFQSKQRIISQFAGCLLVTILIRYVNVWFYDETLFWGYIFPPEGYLYSIFVGLLYVVIVAGIYEGLYYFQKWKQLFSETEALKRENLQTQLDSLKAQINPHFLFNNLSSISSLIMEEPEKAVTYVNELSSVYRYLLQANENDLITIGREMNFVKDYFHLLETRFGNGIQLFITINEQYITWLLPPLTLQLLVENAVKHNTVLPQKPLIIKIYTEGENIVVVNNLQKKTSNIPSNKLGLKTIRSKYELLKKEPIQIEETPEYFKVILPLIKNNIYETAGS